MSEDSRSKAEKILSDIGDRIARYIGRPIQSYIAKRVSDGILDWLFSLVTPEDVVYAVENGETITQMLARCLLSSLPSDTGELLTPENIFSFLRERRPDLASLILSLPGGIDWFEKSIEDVRNSIRHNTGRQQA
ncbi:MAG: hypothetical protein QW503_04645 [Sulfolobales archaeon]